MTPSKDGRTIGDIPTPHLIRTSRLEAFRLNSGLGHQCGQLGNEIHRLEDHVGGAIAIRRFQLSEGNAWAPPSAIRPVFCQSVAGATTIIGVPAAATFCTSGSCVRISSIPQTDISGMCPGFVALDISALTLSEMCSLCGSRGVGRMGIRYFDRFFWML
jgi:hypothetical protein